MTAAKIDREFVAPERLRALKDQGAAVAIVDVRTSAEFAAGHIDGADNIPAAELFGRIDELGNDVAIVTVCTLGGARSCGAADELRALGRDATPLLGCMVGWNGGDNAVQGPGREPVKR